MKIIKNLISTILSLVFVLYLPVATASYQAKGLEYLENDAFGPSEVVSATLSASPQQVRRALRINMRIINQLIKSTQLASNSSNYDQFIIQQSQGMSERLQVRVKQELNVSYGRALYNLDLKVQNALEVLNLLPTLLTSNSSAVRNAMKVLQTDINDYRNAPSILAEIRDLANRVHYDLDQLKINVKKLAATSNTPQERAQFYYGISFINQELRKLISGILKDIINSKSLLEEK